MMNARPGLLGGPTNEAGHPSSLAVDEAARRLERAGIAHAEGRLDEADAAYRGALSLHPWLPEAEHGLGWLLFQQGNWHEALPRFAKALKLKPWEPEFWISQFEVLMQLGQHESVHRLLYRALESGLPHAVADGFSTRLSDARLKVLINALASSGKTTAQAVQAPTLDIIALRDAFLAKRYDAARQQAASLVQRFPLAPFPWRVLAATTPMSDSSDEPMQLRRIACDVDPENVDVAMNLAQALMETKRSDEAEAVFRKVLASEPENMRGLINLGLLLLQRGDPNALTSLREARRQGSTDPRVAQALGGFLRDRDQPDEAIPLLEEALAHDQANDVALAALSACYLAVGRHAESATLFRRIALRNSTDLGALSIGLFVATHLVEIDSDELFAMHRIYGTALESHVVPFDHHPNDRVPERTLRVGFVSGDLRNHAVAYFLAPLWGGLDRSKVTVFAYSNHADEDDTTRALRELSDGWADIHDMSDQAASDRIRKDCIDVLVDLSGHTGWHRLGVFALKPAPVQISCAGYPATTGLTRIDYYMADTTYAPAGLLDAQFTEKLMLGSASASFQPPENCPPVALLPSLHGQAFTFGSFNRMSKLTPMTLQLWARILRCAPYSRMVIGAADEPSQARLRAFFSAAEVDSARLVFLPRTDMPQYLEAHGTIDLLLDTAPYAGGTTTCFGLWMGVPTLTLPGATLPTRTGVAILGRTGLDEFIADSADDFVARAVAWAAPEAGARLAMLREGMRNRVVASNIGSSRGAVESFEDAVRMAWARWCDGLPPAALVVPPRTR